MSASKKPCGLYILFQSQALYTTRDTKGYIITIREALVAIDMEDPVSPQASTKLQDQEKMTMVENEMKNCATIIVNGVSRV